MLHGRLAGLQSIDRRARLRNVGWLGITQLGDCTAGEINAVVQAFVEERTDGDQKRNERNCVEDQRIFHERKVALEAEKFHVSLLFFLR